MEIRLKAAGKINLLLDINGILPNGYHSILTCMQSVSLYDEITVTRTNGNRVTISCDKNYAPADETNLAVRAAKKFFEALGREDGLHIDLKKHIPAGAGMGGGSADAAAVLVGLNEIYSQPFEQSELLSLGAALGADVPFCMLGGTRFCMNKGEIMAPLPNLTGYSIALVKPEVDVSTKNAYSLLDAAEGLRHPDWQSFVFFASCGDFERMLSYCDNIFEQAVEVHDRIEIKAIMRRFGATAAMMTGSGSAVFGLFSDSENAAGCAGELRKKWEEVFLAEPTARSIEIL